MKEEHPLPVSRPPSLGGRLAPHWQGHLLRFDSAPLAPYGAEQGVRLLLIVLGIEGILGPRLGLLAWLGLEGPPAWLRVPLLLGVVLALVRWFAGVKLSQLGLRPWARWSPTERSYFVQVLFLANGIFAAIGARKLAALLGNRPLWGAAGLALAVSLLWGFYQEIIYRGLLQTELVRRWGAVGGILVSNLLYTFGPLHFYHFGHGKPLGTGILFAGIFAIGLFFGLLFQRSGNLWMVGIFHGLGDWYLVGLSGLVS